MPKYKDILLHLRNQHKIKAALGDEKLEMIKGSIEVVMDSDKDLEPQKIEGSQYDIIMIDDASGENSMIVFYIVRTDFNIYTLAFKEFI
jgi:hypothetical protein